MEFKIGDKVRIVRNNGPAFFDKYINKITTICEINNVGDIYVPLPNQNHAPTTRCNKDELELVKPEFKNWKIHVRSPEESEQVQKALFKLGYVWSSYTNQVLYTNRLYLFTYKDGTFISNNDTKNFGDYKNKEEVSPEYVIRLANGDDMSKVDDYILKNDKDLGNLKVGDMVKIRDDLEDGSYYGDYLCIEPMKKYKGQIVKIIKAYTEFYDIDLDGRDFNWSKEMFERKIRPNDWYKDRPIKENKKEFEVNKMEKPKTKLEKNALKEAKEIAIKEAISAKAENYNFAMHEFIKKEERARALRVEADEMREVLDVSDKQMEELF